MPTKQTTLLVTKQPTAKKQDDEEEGTKNNASTTTKEGALPEKAEGGNIMAEKMGEEDMDIEKAGGGEVGIIVEKSLGEGKQISLQIPMDVVADAKAAAVLKEAAIAEDRAATNAEEAGIAEDGSATNAEEAAVTEDRAATADTQQTANESDAVEEATAAAETEGTPSILYFIQHEACRDFPCRSGHVSSIGTHLEQSCESSHCQTGKSQVRGHVTHNVYS